MVLLSLHSSMMKEAAKVKPIFFNHQEIALSSTPGSSSQYRILSPRCCDGVGLAIAFMDKPTERSVTRSDLIRSLSDSAAMEILEENFTYVTSHQVDKTVTKVYYDAGEYSSICGGSAQAVKEQSKTTVQTSGFLESCDLCGRKLHGRDVYMYRGESAFCSEDCREEEMMMEESKPSRSKIRAPLTGEVSSTTAYGSTAASPIFSAELMAL